MNHRALDRALELPHIAGPVIVHQRGQRGRAGPMDGFSHTGPSLAEERGDEEGNIFFSLPERRELDPCDSNPVEQVGAEGAFRDILALIVVSGRQHPHVDFSRFGLTQSRDFFLLQHTK